ncbi:MAG: beta-Ala-His dipeptidase [Selenomonadaceae bacterium]|nr:beta-Ala-His dipeptidase [Selenomonadaceae bacterium]
MNDEILEGVLDEFKKLAEIPRPSKHEEKISGYLQKYLLSLGFDVTQDQHKNIIAEIPASEGKEDAPLTILQAHMDMVCVAEDGYNYDALTSPIKLLRTEKFLEAEGTSLGADDGMGIAEILYITKNFFNGKFENVPHGPILLIFTSDEEQGMGGAININKEHFNDAQFMINCDSENFDVIVVGSAGHLSADFTRQINFLNTEIFSSASNSAAMKIKICGLRGGHSGIEIDDNRANAIKILTKFLHELNLRGNVRLSKIDGGTVQNVIPSSAEAVIVTDLNFEDVKNFSDEFSARMKKIFVDEVNLKIIVDETDMPSKIFSVGDFNDLIDLVTLIHSGIFSTSNTSPKFIQASANLGVIRTDEKISVKVMSRFNIDELAEEFETVNKTLAKVTNFDVKFGEHSPAWIHNPKSTLGKIAAEIFAEQNNFSAQIKTIHAGLECSHFIGKNPALEIISIGTTNEFIHSTRERLHLDTVTPQVNLIVETLKRIAELKAEENQDD